MKNPRPFNTWVRRGLVYLQGTDKNLVIGGSRYLGAPHLLNCYKIANEKVIDFELAPMFTVHEEFLASVFAHAVNEALGWRALPAAVSLDYQARLLAQRLPDLNEYTVIIRNADFGRLLIQELQTLRHPPRLILEATTPGLVTAKHALHLDPRSLLLSAEEAEEIGNAWGGRAASEWQRVYSLSGGQYQLFLDNLPRTEGVDVPDWELPIDESSVSREDLFEALLNLGRLTDALEVAAPQPELVDRLLREGAGSHFAEEGILAYLKVHLDSLPEPYISSELALEWRLIGAVKGDTRDLPDITARVGAYLESNEAPLLRARYGGIIGGETGLTEARRALSVSRHPKILYQVAMLTPDQEEAVRLFREAARKAHENADHHEFVRNAQQLARRMADRGEFVEAADLAARALALIDENGLMNGTRRRELVYELATYRWMTGKSVGLRESVRIEAEALGPGEERARFLLLLAAMAAARGDAKMAGEKLRTLTEVERVVNPAVSVMHQVQYLLLLEGDPKARKAAREAAVDALEVAGSDRELRARALVAYAAAHVEVDADAATTALLDADALLGPGFSPLRMSLELYLARATGSRVREEYRHLFKEVPYQSLRLLGGDGKEFHRIYSDLLNVGGVKLVIGAFDKGEVIVDGQMVRVTKQMMETLLVLALNPQGLTPDELQARLSPTMTSNHVKVVVSRLRKKVPITRGPYRLDCRYALNLDVVRDYLNQGRLVRALEIARGRVLPWSDAIDVQRARAEMEAELRAAVLASSDPEVMAAALEALRYDAVVQEHALRKLKELDARRHKPTYPGQQIAAVLELQESY